MTTSKRILSYILYIALSTGSLVAIYFALSTMGAQSLWIAGGCLLAGYLLWGFIYVFIHEMGHLIGGFIGGFKFYAFTVLFFKFIKINGKLKMRLTFSRNIAGYCQMIPPCGENLIASFSKYVKGSLVASISFLIAAFAAVLLPFAFPELFAGNYIIYCLIAPAFIANFPTHISNFSEMVQNPTTDGAVIRGIKENSLSARTQVKMLSIQSLLFSGTRPCDLDASLFESLEFDSETEIYAPLFESYNLSRNLDLKNYEAVIASSDFIKVNYKKTTEVFHKLLLADVFYVELVLKNNIDEAERIYFYIASFLKSQTDIATLRIRMAKEIFIDGSFSQALNTGVLAKNLASTYEAKGAGEMECEIIDELSVIARNKKEDEFKNMSVDFVQAE